MSLNPGTMSSATDEWPTPQALYEALNLEFGGFDLDPCCNEFNRKCRRFFTPSDDGLMQEWTGKVYMNPPYGRQIDQWVEKAYNTALAGHLVVCLLPARTDTIWWHEYCKHGDVRFIQGRLKFGDGKGRAPFPSAIVVFRPFFRQLPLNRQEILLGLGTATP